MMADHAGGRGREAQWALLHTADEASAQQGRLVVVRGPAGIGKSALLSTAARRWRAEGVRVLSAPVGSGADGLGVSAVLSMIREHFEQLNDSRIADLVGVVTRLKASRNPHTVSRMIAGLSGLFEHIGRLGRTVLLFDDADTIAEPAAVLRAARRPGCLVVAACRDTATTPGTRELAALADEIIDLAPLPDDEAATVAARYAGGSLDDATLSALHAALGPLFGNPGTIQGTLAQLRAQGRLTALDGRLCLRDPESPIALPPDHDLLARTQPIDALAPGLLTAVAAFGGIAVDDLPPLADALGATVTDCGLVLDRMVESGVLVANSSGQVWCCCPALATSAVENADANVRMLHGVVAEKLLKRLQNGENVNPSELADHLAQAGTASPDELAWLIDQAEQARHIEPGQAVRWYGHALRLIADSPRPPRKVADIVATFLRLVVRTGEYGLFYDLFPGLFTGAGSDPGLRADLHAVAMLATVHTGRSLPSELQRPINEERSGGDPLGFCAWWLGTGSPQRDQQETESSARPPVLSAAELNLVRHALSGDLTVCRREWARVRHGHPAAEADRLAEAGALGDLATVFEIVLGPRYGVPATGMLTAYQRVVRCYASGDWSAALSAAREVALSSPVTCHAHQAARLFAAEICSARGNFPRATEWLSQSTPDTMRTALWAWVDCGLAHRMGNTRQALESACQSYRQLRRDETYSGAERLLLRAVDFAVSLRDTATSRTMLDEIEDLHQRMASRNTTEAWYLARGLVHGNPVDARKGAAMVRQRGHRPDLLTACLIVADSAKDPRPALDEAYAVAKECDAALQREQIRTLVRQYGLPVPRMRSHREPFSATERRVIELISQGMTNRLIGQHMRISQKTVENHITRVLAKTGLRSRVELAAANIGGRLPAAA